jgi:hypothetical protein
MNVIWRTISLFIVVALRTWWQTAWRGVQRFVVHAFYSTYVWLVVDRMLKAEKSI